MNGHPTPEQMGDNSSILNLLPSNRAVGNSYPPVSKEVADHLNRSLRHEAVRAGAVVAGITDALTTKADVMVGAVGLVPPLDLTDATRAIMTNVSEGAGASQLARFCRDRDTLGAAMSFVLTFRGVPLQNVNKVLTHLADYIKASPGTAEFRKSHRRLQWDGLTSLGAYSAGEVVSDYSGRIVKLPNLRGTINRYTEFLRGKGVMGELMRLQVMQGAKESLLWYIGVTVDSANAIGSIIQDFGLLQRISTEGRGRLGKVVEALQANAAARDGLLGELDNALGELGSLNILDFTDVQGAAGRAREAHNLWGQVISGQEAVTTNTHLVFDEIVRAGTLLHGEALDRDKHDLLMEDLQTMFALYGNGLMGVDLALHTMVQIPVALRIGLAVEQRKFLTGHIAIQRSRLDEVLEELEVMQRNLITVHPDVKEIVGTTSKE